MKEVVARAKRAGIRRISGCVLSNAYERLRLAGRRIRYNYYLKNWAECRRNKKLLNQARDNWEELSRNKRRLISVQIPTYNRAKISTERTIPSVLRQTYQDFEIIIVGDHCTDNTEELLGKFNERRIEFYNLPERGSYPANPIDRWRVAGVQPANKGIELCSGDWIAALDDDDESSEEHIEVLLDYALEHDHEMVYGAVRMETEPGRWINLGSYPPRCGRICHPTVLYHARLKFFRYDVDSWKYGEPADWNMRRRMKEAGVRIGFVDRVVGKHDLKRT